MNSSKLLDALRSRLLFGAIVGLLFSLAALLVRLVIGDLFVGFPFITFFPRRFWLRWFAVIEPELSRLFSVVYLPITFCSTRFIRSSRHPGPI
jgi:hypothetical protein